MNRLPLEPGREEELYRAWYEEWLAVGLSTDPADRPRAEEAVREAYRLAGRIAPPLRWVESPLGAMEVVAERGPPGILSEITGPVHASLPAGERVPPLVRPASTFFLWYTLRRSLEWGFARSIMSAARRASPVPERWRSLPEHFLRGQMEFPEVAYYRFFEEYGPVEAPRSETLALREELCRSCGGVWPWGGVCVLGDRAAEIHTEELREDRRIHRENGPAVTFRDGFQVWALHGVGVPKRVVEDRDSLTPDDIRNEFDADARRVMLELFGLLRYLEESEAHVLDEVPSGAEGVPAGLRGARLLRAPWSEQEPLVVVSVVDPATSQRCAIRVPPETQTVAEGVAWTFELAPDVYRPEVEV